MSGSGTGHSSDWEGCMWALNSFHCVLSLYVYTVSPAHVPIHVIL
jgi:hypothetical protein